MQVDLSPLCLFFKKRFHSFNFPIFRHVGLCIFVCPWFVSHKAVNRMPGDGILLFVGCLRKGQVYSYSGKNVKDEFKLTDSRKPCLTKPLLYLKSSATVTLSVYSFLKADYVCEKLMKLFPYIDNNSKHQKNIFNLACLHFQHSA